MMRMMMRRRRSRDEQQIGMRLWKATIRDKSRDVPLVPLATPPPLTIRAVYVLTPMMMIMMVVPGLLQEVMILIGLTSRVMTSRC